MQQIANFYKNTIKHSNKFNSTTSVDDQSLLYPDFLAKVKVCIAEYKMTYPNQDITFTETYRSNVLQAKYYANGASKIKKDGMHHFGIAADCIFIVDGKRTYKGDINLIRKIYKAHGLTILGMWDSLHVQYIPISDQMGLRLLCNG
ncbi:hypothetical protein OX283_009465 [Flavobacterium sp. SUN052]|uniref:hypothetical protein n=1 Tax=Flavobacterium sp. SUN052 TaxID=3002441 RepID=UPI00237D7A4B|nr:hypothetical protein [Flavobacterium sp. SUN052]MEC4004882.1 hypothetical protein [Flavobacterium sp. SUN052]